VITASGPLDHGESMANFDKLLEYIINNRPHAAILTGPFIDSRNEATISGNTDALFVKLMTALSNCANKSGTEIILIPSLLDFTHPNVFPSPGYDLSKVENVSKRLRVMANPCTINISGVTFGVSSADILFHLIREEVSRQSKEQEAGERMRRLCEHLINQRSYYPLFPPNAEINCDFTSINNLVMNVTPHLMILPSDLKCFVRNASNCICLNPERLSKGVFARIKIDKTPEEFSGSLESFINVEVLKLEKVVKKLE
jgi:DNA polymerase alpha subunit B